jgi:PAS domain S-box-containing protein
MALALIVIVQSLIIAALLVLCVRRARVERAVRESEERFRLMADRAPVMVWTTRPDTTLDYLNGTCVEFTGLPLDQLLGEGWLDAVHPEDRDHCTRIYKPAVEARTPFRMEYRIRRADGVYRWVMDLGVPKYGPGDRFLGYVGSTIDITERKESEEKFRLAIEAAPAGMIMIDRAGEIVLVNAEAERLFHYDRKELIGTSVETLVPGLFRDGLHELYGLRKNGVKVPLEVRLNPLDAPAGELVLVSVVDIAERLRAERENRDLMEQLQHLAGSLITAQDAERARIARDLHDGVSQQLAALSIALSGFKRRLGTRPGDVDVEAALSAIQQRAVALAESVRDISHDLHPNVLKHAGLTAALADHCASVSRTHALAVTCTTDGDFETIRPETALCLYRIAQEALHNVIKHANARRVEVRLFRRSDIAELAIADDGKGFDVAETRKSRKGLGLVSINERVRLAGGTLSVMTEWNKGTRIQVRLPASESSDVGKVPGPFVTT